jgi:hypothetical protein
MDRGVKGGPGRARVLDTSPRRLDTASGLKKADVGGGAAAAKLGPKVEPKGGGTTHIAAAAAAAAAEFEQEFADIDSLDVAGPLLGMGSGVSLGGAKQQQQQQQHQQEQQEKRPLPATLALPQEQRQQQHVREVDVNGLQAEAFYAAEAAKKERAAEAAAAAAAAAKEKQQQQMALNGVHSGRSAGGAAGGGEAKPLFPVAQWAPDKQQQLAGVGVDGEAGLEIQAGKGLGRRGSESLDDLSMSEGKVEGLLGLAWPGRWVC